MTEKNKTQWSKAEINGLRVLCGMAFCCFLCGYLSGKCVTQSISYNSGYINGFKTAVYAMTPKASAYKE